MFEPNDEVELTYPESTLVEANTTFRRRRLQIREIRDLITDPITPEEYLRRPLTQRSRYLLTAYDKDSKSWRQFYVGSSKEFLTDGRLRIALYEKGGTSPQKIVSRSFEATRRDRIALARAVKEMQEKDLAGLELRIVPDESRVLKQQADKPKSAQPKAAKPKLVKEAFARKDSAACAVKAPAMSRRMTASSPLVAPPF
ncbi:hypothetical protein RISK_000342 [Rhodopirellula islandica]|uniref:Uncharacterized protein n=1 Tax=Rhodopirellula islandica TaxID=595434 RepID=A0A0J1BMF5_RHOIS|nr:hypothetical protein [Rhodopirellula islandica]KLU07665.1 hypothetical protein RISK_000342 [Rhodopirellula islandica]